MDFSVIFTDFFYGDHQLLHRLAGKVLKAHAREITHTRFAGV